MAIECSVLEDFLFRWPEVPSSDIVLFTQNTNTDTKIFSPTWTWSMTELTRLQLTYSTE